jgi:hypothetical protein
MSASGADPMIFGPSRTRKSSPFCRPVRTTNHPTTGSLGLSADAGPLRPPGAVPASSASFSNRVRTVSVEGSVGNPARGQYGQTSQLSSIWCPLAQNFGTACSSPGSWIKIRIRILTRVTRIISCSRRPIDVKSPLPRRHQVHTILYFQIHMMVR